MVALENVSAEEPVPPQSKEDAPVMAQAGSPSRVDGSDGKEPESSSAGDRVAKSPQDTPGEGSPSEEATEGGGTDDELEHKESTSSPETTKAEEARRKQKIDELLGCTKKLSDMSLDDKYEFLRRYREVHSPCSDRCGSQLASLLCVRFPLWGQFSAADLHCDTIAVRYILTHYHLQAGNHFFREGDYAFALKTWQEAMTFIKHGIHLGEGDSITMGGPPRPLDPRANTFLFLLLSNSAACHLKQENYSETISFCGRAAKLEADVSTADNAKLYYRWGQALASSAKHEAALEHLENASEILSTNLYFSQNAQIIKSLEITRRVVKKIEREAYAAAKTTWGGKLPPTAPQESDMNAVEIDMSRRSSINHSFLERMLLWCLGFFAQLWRKLKQLIRQ